MKPTNHDLTPDTTRWADGVHRIAVALENRVQNGGWLYGLEFNRLDGDIAIMEQVVEALKRTRAMHFERLDEKAEIARQQGRAA